MVYLHDGIEATDNHIVKNIEEHGKMVMMYMSLGGKIKQAT